MTRLPTPKASPLPIVAYKILNSEQFAQWQSEREFRGAPIDLKDGYIHLSTADQLIGTLDKHFSGQTGLVIASINLTALGDTVRWEESRGGQLFPHIYGQLPLSAVLAHEPLKRFSDGELDLPA